MKTFMAAVDKLGAERSSAIRGRVDPQSLRSIELAGSLSWLPIDINVAVTGAVMTELSPEDSKAFFRDMVLDNFETPLFAGLIRASIRLLGLEPKAMAKMIGRIVGIMFRDNGEWSTSGRRHDHAILSIRGLAPACRNQMWVDSVQHCLSAFHPFVKVSGDVMLSHLDLVAGDVDFEIRWAVAVDSPHSPTPTPPP